LSLCQSYNDRIKFKLHKIWSPINSYKLFQSYIKSKSNHIRFAVIAVATSDDIIAFIRAESNLSINNYTVINKDIRKATTNSLYNRKLDNASI
jgi:hypothetical protein